MEEDEEAMLELELAAGAGNDEDVDDDSLMMALGEDDSLFGSEAPDGQQAAPLCSTPIKKARLVRGESLTDFLSQELDDGLAPTASPASTSEPHSQPISESSNGVNTTKSGEEGCSEAVSTQQEDSGSDTAPVEPTEATAAGDEDEDEAWKSQAEPEGDANEGGHESDDMVMEDEGEQEGETADGDATVSSSGPGGSNGDSDDGDSDGDDAGGDGGDGDSDNDAGVSDDEMGGGDDVEMGDTEDDAADEAEQTVDESEDNAQCVCVTLTENGEDGEGEGEGGEAGEELVVFQDRPELYSSPLSAFMQALQEELSMANDIVLEFQGLSLKFYTNLPFVEKLSLYDLAFLHSKLNMEGCLTAELTEESTNFLARYNELVALSQAEPEAEEVLGKRSIGTEDDEGEGAPQQPKRRRS